MGTTPFHDTTVRVRYAETDQMGVVYHSNYFIWFEVGRVELIRSLGIEYKKKEMKATCPFLVPKKNTRNNNLPRSKGVLPWRQPLRAGATPASKFATEVFPREPPL